MSLSQSGTPLDVLLRSLEAFADGSAQHDVATALAVEGQRLIRRGFSESRAPDGTPWRPLRRPRPGGRPLVKTRRLAAAAALYTVDRRGFVFGRIDALASYGLFHQSEGARTSNLPRRPFYPDAEGLPLGWSISLAAGADEALRAHLP